MRLLSDSESVQILSGTSVSISILLLLLDSVSSCSQGKDRILAIADDLRVDGLKVETDVKSPFSSCFDLTKEL